MAKNYYITTPIYYINDIPHLGHAYTTVAADVIARYQRKKGDKVFYLTGVDEHGAKIAEAAEKAGKSPKQFVDDLVPVFEKTWRKLNISFTKFFRTTDPTHESLVKEIVAMLLDKGFVQKRKYEGLYCVGCERYLLPADLVGGKCLDHDKEPVKQSEENYFFLLSNFEKKLLDIIESGELAVEPESRKNEIIGKIKNGLEDISISRKAVKWGIGFPGDESQTIYVWVDALLNYYTAKEIFGQESWEKHPADLHLMAKDILWFHAIIWPAMLMALNLPLPKKIFAHGFFTVNNRKMSKTIGNILDPNSLVEKYGADAVRYAILREFPFGEDGDISEEKIARRYQNDLSNELGNLLQRTLSMINRYQVKIESVEGYYDYEEEPSSEEVPTTEVIVEQKLRTLEFDQALSAIWKLVQESNQYIDSKKPWQLAKEQKENELKRVLNLVYARLGSIANLLEVFMPETSQNIRKQLDKLEPKVLFPRLNEEK